MTSTHTDPLGDFLDDATRTEIRQHRNGREIVWGLRVLGPAAALEVPEVLDLLLSSAQKLLKTAGRNSQNPALAEALEAVRSRDTKGRKVEETTTEEAADIVERLQSVAIRSVESISLDGDETPCRLVRAIGEQSPKGFTGPGLRRIWVGILDQRALQAIYLAAAARIEEALGRVARFPGPAGPSVDAGSDGEGVRLQAEPAPEPAA